MAFNPKNLSVLAYANSYTLWHYRTEDGLLALTQPSYFDPADHMLRVGDMMMVNASVESDAPVSDMLSVASNKKSRVTVASLIR